MKTVHQSPYCGSWFPRDRAELEGLLREAFAKSERRTGDYLVPGAVAFVVPHAGLVYSGTVAAAAYRHIRAQGVERAVVIGFSHSVPFFGVRVPRVAAYATPLGEIQVDREGIDDLVRRGVFQLVEEEAVCDHSVEIQLPLLAAANPAIRIIPVYAGRTDSGELRQAAYCLARLLDTKTVLVASSDLTHYGRAFGYLPFPSDSHVIERLHSLDEEVIQAAGSLDADFFRKEVSRTGSTVCGQAPIRLLLETLACIEGGEVFQEKLDYQTSAEITGERDHSVSYGALGYFPERSFYLDGEEQRLLLESAKGTLAEYAASRMRRPVAPLRVTPAMRRKASAFVTLRLRGELRGCIGCAAGGRPLAAAVPELTLKSALDDPRFDHLPGAELGDELEISVLTPSKRISRLEQFEPGVHGATVESGIYHGLLLPQVARERRWGRDEFFSALAHKAGAPADIYGKDETVVSVFRAQVFSGAAGSVN